MQVVYVLVMVALSLVDEKKKIKKEKNFKQNSRNQNPCHSLFSGGDHLRSNLGNISGLGIICGRVSFAAL